MFIANLGGMCPQSPWSLRLLAIKINLENKYFSLQKEYKAVATTGTWNKKIDLPRGETIIFHNANVIVHYRPSTEMLDWTGEDSKSRPRVVRRGISDIMDEILEGI